MRRTDEEQRTYFRVGDRVYQEGESWYYSTREGEHGPFKDRQEAEADMERYVGLQSHLDKLVTRHVKLEDAERDAEQDSEEDADRAPALATKASELRVIYDDEPQTNGRRSDPNAA